MHKLVLLRHGESTWNLSNRFTGWTDVDLTATGVEQARAAGRLLREEAFEFDRAWTSVLKRAIKTLNLALDALGLLWLPVEKSWRLNERHYDKLQGLNKTEIRGQFGDEQFMTWRRSYDTPPPELDRDNEWSQFNDARYADIPEDERPQTECLKDVVMRMLPYWESDIVPDLHAGDVGDRVVLAGLESADDDAQLA